MTKQLSGKGERVEPKTAQAVRSVILMPSLSRVLKEHLAASRYCRPSDFVFASATGKALDGRNVAQRGLQAAAEAAGLVPPKPKKGEKRALATSDQRQRLTMHELRHCFASLLVAQGEDVTFVGSQLGHANPSITLRIYAHLFEHARHAERARAALESAYGNVLETSADSEGSPGVPDEQTQVVDMQGFRTRGN